MAAQQLIPVFTGQITEETIQYCNARDLHASLKVETRFNDWIDRRIEDYGFVEGEDFYSNLSKTPKGSKGGRPTIDYHLTLDMAKELAMIENNEIGRAVRRYFIQAEKTLREKLLAELRDKAEHVLPVRGVKLMRDGLNMKDTFRLQDQSHKVLRMMMAAKTKAERQNLYYHFRQINLVLGVPTIELDQIEQDECYGQPEKRG
jgi:phage anti-repressor protein